MRSATHSFGFVAGENLALALLEHRDESIDAGAQPRNLAGIQVNRAGELFFSKLAVLAEHQHVLHDRRNHVRRRLRGTRKPRRVVPLIGMNDAAECFAIGHDSCIPLILGEGRG